MARFSARDAAFYALPAAIGCAAIYFALRREGPGEPSPAPPEVQLTAPCAVGHHRCHQRAVQTTTGEEAVDAKPDRCVWRTVSSCTQRCVAEDVTLGGVSDEVASAQLCDPPADAESLVTDAKNHLAESVQDAAVCEGDGYLPTSDGIQQCILRSAVDPTSLGVVVSSARCRLGAIATLDRAPRLIKREQAIALWCKRDPNAPSLVDTGATDGSDARTD